MVRLHRIRGAQDWLGAKQRSTTTETAALTLMGDRLYNPTTDTFTSLDPIPGGNTTAYTYPTDPINMSDLDGRIAKAMEGGAMGGWIIPAPRIPKSAMWLSASGAAAIAAARYLAVDKADRDAHPNPRRSMRRNYGYVMYFRGRDGDRHVWKYGVSSVGESRPRRQISTCVAMMKSIFSFSIVRVFNGRLHALAWESRAVTSYRLRHGGHCPPGQWRSCR